TTPSATAEGSVLGKLVVADRNSTAVVVSRDDVYGNDIREAIVAEIRKSGGQVLDSFNYDPNTPDYTKDVQRVKDKNPDAIVLIGFTEGSQILSQMIK
ncbi:MAG: ABC transporter substrate-binding protein, partial [Pseudomonas sp.]